jgi:hypothetical protein
VAKPVSLGSFSVTMFRLTENDGPPVGDVNRAHGILHFLPSQSRFRVLGVMLCAINDQAEMMGIFMLRKLLLSCAAGTAMVGSALAADYPRLPEERRRRVWKGVSTALTTCRSLPLGNSRAI